MDNRYISAAAAGIPWSDTVKINDTFVSSELCEKKSVSVIFFSSVKEASYLELSVF